MDIVPGVEESTVPHHTHSSKEMFDFKHLHFPSFKHETHPKVKNVNEIADDRLTLGQKVADSVANGMGSWNFIIIQSTILVLWIILNSVGWFVWKWDAYPFIAMNLLLSCQAAYAAPVIMMSQNRQAEKDRLTAQNDYLTDCKGEEEIRHIMQHLDHQDALILQLLNQMSEQRKELLERLTKLDPEMAGRLVADVQQITAQPEA